MSTRQQWTLAWSLLFALNLPLATMAGTGFVTPIGHVGMLLAVALCYALGLLICKRPRLARALVLGSSIPMALQFLVIPHAIAGSVACELWNAMTGAFAGRTSSATLGPVGAFVVTMLTALQLLTVAMLFGLYFRWAFEKEPRQNANRNATGPG